MRCDYRVYSIRSATSVIAGEGVWCEQKVCSIKNVKFAVQIEKVFSSRRVAVQGEGCAV